MSFAEAMCPTGYEDRMIQERLAQKRKERADAIAQLEQYNNPEAYPKISFLRRFENNTDVTLVVSDKYQDTIQTLLEKNMLEQVDGSDLSNIAVRLTAEGQSRLEEIQTDRQTCIETIKRIDAEFDADKQTDKQIRAGIIGMGIAAGLGFMGSALERPTIEAVPICIDVSSLDKKDQPQAVQNIRYLTDNGEVVVIKDTCE